MKTRNGFVSNSSSSSFFCVVPKTIHDKVMDKLSKKQKSIMEKYLDHGKVGDIDVVGYGHAHDRGEGSSYSGSICFSDYGEKNEIEYDDFDDATSAYEKALKEHKSQTFNMSFDF
jgi:hypothetical protein